MITLLDKWGHFGGAFFFIKVLLHYFERKNAIRIVAIGAILIEAYQWIFQPYYEGKILDTIFDLIFDAIGIACGVWI